MAGGPPSPPKKHQKRHKKSHKKPRITKKIGLFHEKIICLEKPKMQNKHNFFSSFLGIPTYGEGGSSLLGQIPNFYRKFVLEASLIGWEGENLDGGS